MPIIKVGILNQGVRQLWICEEVNLHSMRVTGYCNKYKRDIITSMSRLRIQVNNNKYYLNHILQNKSCILDIPLVL